MSIKVMQLVLDKSRHKGSALLLETVIANFAHDDGSGAYPSTETLAAYIRMTKRNTQLLLRTLERSNELKTFVGIGPFGTNVYEIDVEKLDGMKSFHPRRTQYARMKERGKGVKESLPGVKKQSDIRMKATSSKPNRHQNRQRTVKEPSSSGKRKTDDDALRKPPGIIAHLAELMTIHLGIDATAAIDLAKLPHVNEHYIQEWNDFNTRDIKFKLTAHQDDNVLGAGFYYDRIKRGLTPQPFGRMAQ